MSAEREPDEIDRKLSESISSRIRKGLADKGWSAADLAREAGCSAMLISQLLSGKSGASLATVVQLAKALGCSVDEFFPES